MKAIRHVTENWGVDIVSFSFGYANTVKSIAQAISKAESVTDDQVLFFAAANNRGQNQDEMFPAFNESVIAVRGTTYDGAPIESYCPSQLRHQQTTVFGTLAKEVLCDWCPGGLTMSGCSVATPILAAIAAMIMQLLESESAYIQSLIRTRRGMISVFYDMTKEQNRDVRYVTPWALFKGEEVKLNKILAALEDIS